MGQMDEGAAHLREAIRLQPANDLAHFDLGSIYLRQARPADAYQEFLTTTRLNPEDSQAFGSLGIVCLQTGRRDEARECFQTTLRLNPDDALAARYLEKLNSTMR
jgi:Flp pilus assembly protein TadD